MAVIHKVVHMGWTTGVDNRVRSYGARRSVRGRTTAARPRRDVGGTSPFGRLIRLTPPEDESYRGADVRVESRPGPWDSQRERRRRDPRDAPFRSSTQEYTRDQADLPAEQPPSRQGAWLPQAHVHPGRARRARRAAPQGPRASRRLRCSRPRTECCGVRISSPQYDSVRAAAAAGWSSTTAPARPERRLRLSSASSFPRSRSRMPLAAIGSSVVFVHS